MSYVASPRGILDLGLMMLIDNVEDNLRCLRKLVQRQMGHLGPRIDGVHRHVLRTTLDI